MRKPKLTEYGDYATWVSFEVMANYQVQLIITDDLMKSAKGRINSSPEEADAFCFHVKGAGRSYIFLRHDSDESVVAHECWHIVHRVLTYCGVADMDDEIVAYHLDHMVEKVYEFKKAIQSSTKKEASDGRKKRRTSSPSSN
jgi:hypothetical protein